MLREPKEPVSSSPSVGEVIGILGKNRDSTLEHGQKYRKGEGYIAQADLPGGRKETLSDVLLIGGTAMGISKIYDNQGGVEYVRLSVLPVGDMSGIAGNNQSSLTLFDIDPRALGLPRDNGVVQPWQTWRIGRGDIAGRTGVTDSTVSGQHLEVTVDSKGAVTVLDGQSANGTYAIGEGTLMRSEDAGGLSQSDKLRVCGLVEPLCKKPTTWQASTAGRMIVNP